MDTEELLERYAAGERDFAGITLRSVDLQEAILIDINFCGADLSYSNFDDADLSNANLSYANLKGADLSNTTLFQANLEGVNLEDANLTGTDLELTNLENANLRTDAIFCQTVMPDGTIRDDDCLESEEEIDE